MIRSTTTTAALLICVVLAALVHVNSATSNNDLVKGAVTSVLDTSKQIAEDLKAVIDSVVADLKNIVIGQAVKELVTKLRTSLKQLLGAILANQEPTAQKALTLIEDALNGMGDSLEGVGSELESLGDALGEVLKAVVDLVNQLLAVVAGILGGLLPNLKPVLDKLITTLTGLTDTTVNDLVGTLVKQVTNIDDALLSLGDIVKAIVDKVPSMDAATSALAIGSLVDLTGLQGALSNVIQAVLNLVNVLLAALTQALTNLSKSLVPALDTTVGVVGSCSTCLGAVAGVVGRRRRYVA